MIAATVLLFIILLCFCGVVFFGAPYLPTLTPQVAAALKLVELDKGDTLLELGCGDGKVLLAAARQGIHSVGYELNPILAGIAWLRTRKHRDMVTVIWGDFWQANWPKANAIFVFLLPKYMDKLDKKCMQYKHKPVKLVSFAFKIESKKPEKVIANVSLYQYK